MVSKLPITQAKTLDPENKSYQKALKKALQQAEEEEIKAQIKALMEKANDQMDANDYAGAAATMQEALHLDPENRDALEAEKKRQQEAKDFALMRDLQKKGEQALAADKPEEAMSYFDQALKLAPKGLAGEMGEKSNDAVRAIESKDAAVAVFVKQGQAQYAAMEFDKALDSYNKALALAPKKKSGDAAAAGGLEDTVEMRTNADVQFRGKGSKFVTSELRLLGHALAMIRTDKNSKTHTADTAGCTVSTPKQARKGYEHAIR